MIPWPNAHGVPARDDDRTDLDAAYSPRSPLDSAESRGAIGPIAGAIEAIAPFGAPTKHEASVDYHHAF
jgi:hypothetical protein